MLRDDGYRLGHRPALDGLRGIAILLVVFGHAETPGFGGAGEAGVTLFFVLSGFLITRLLLEEAVATGSIDRKAFYVRRARRILPAMVTVALSFWAAATLGGVSALPAILVLTNTMDFFGPLAVNPALLMHMWSLSMEEQFYALWPFVVLPLTRFRHRVPLLLGVIAVVNVNRVLQINDPSAVLVVLYRPDVRLDAIVLGCLLGILAQVVQHVRGLGFTALVATAISIPLIPLSGLEVKYTLLVFGLASVALVAWAAVSPVACRSRILMSRPLRWTGRISYGMYAFHVFAIPLARSLAEPGLVRTLVLVACAYIAGALSWYIIERPFLRSAPGRTRSREEPMQRPSSGLLEGSLGGRALEAVAAPALLPRRNGRSRSILSISRRLFVVDVGSSDLAKPWYRGEQREDRIPLHNRHGEKQRRGEQPNALCAHADEYDDHCADQAPPQPGAGSPTIGRKELAPVPPILGSQGKGAE